jgi:uncharacterized phage infection (PIP) family protein YhgE
MRAAFRIATGPQTWVMPFIMILGLAILFPLIYLSSTVDPQQHLHGLPVALVVEPQSAVEPDFAAKVAQSIEAHDGSDKIALEPMTPQDLDVRMANDQVAGAIVLPATFNEDLLTLMPGSVAAVTTPTIEVRTNAGDGGISNGLFTSNVLPLLSGVDTAFGGTLLASAGSAGAPVDRALEHLLAAPFQVHVTPFTTLPENAGLGMSAFYYALILVLLGFVGASLVNPFIDSALGFAPSELGPLVMRRPYSAVTRTQTLLIKFATMVPVAPIAALAVELIAGVVIGIPIPDPVQLWALSAAAVAAVGVSALTVFALFGGGIGSLANTLFFIALAMTASGGTVPLSALPPFFSNIAAIEPFRPILEGVRAILFFDANRDAGLGNAWLHIGIGGALGIGLGLLATYVYSKKQMFTRHPRPAVPAHAQ